MRVSFVVGAALVLTLTVTLAAADPPAPSPTASDYDAVATVMLKLVDAKTRADAALARSVITLPLQTTWHANNGGECTVPRAKTVTDPLKAVAALSFDPHFVAALRRDKGHVHAGTGCAEESSSAQFTHGDPAITVTGDTATVRYSSPVCEAGAPDYTFTLRRTAGAWSLARYDSGCHYDES
jgi:hypothetical protein